MANNNVSGNAEKEAGTPGGAAAALARMRQLHRAPEPQCVLALLASPPLEPARSRAGRQMAERLARQLRERRAEAGGIDALMHEFSLSSQEGVALMCLAEALLRIPDAATADALIRDKLSAGQWRSHIGRSRSLFVNAAAWGLMISGELVSTHSEEGLVAALGRLIVRGGEGLIRRGVDMAMRLLGQQFVLGRTIDEALERARECEARGYRYSFDMLGEAAMTAPDADRYFADYERAIDAIGLAARLPAGGAAGVHAGNGISVKLSALHPRYARSQRDRVLAELAPRVAHLCRRARDHGIGLNIDAEECEFLELSLDLVDALARDASLGDWDGLGVVVQAYQKRAPAVIDWLDAVARGRRRRMMVRLVKGAYWDSEIKRAQVDGMPGFPVFTRKLHTDLSYEACAHRLLECAARLYPQFATHNALTLATIRQMCEQAGVADWEFQCLHGMGESLYDGLVGPQGEGLRCRIYAPVGSHETLLAYLVRRLLENGANTSFVSQVVDPSFGLERLLADPRDMVRDSGGRPNPAILAPSQLYGPRRPNSAGLDLTDEDALDALAAGFREAAARSWQAAPAGAGAARPGQARPVTNPARRSQVVGSVVEAGPGDIDRAMGVAAAAAPQWAGRTPAERAGVLRAAADALESERLALMWLVVHEAGRTLAAAAGEVREAADFCRYYAAQLEAGPALDGEPLGPVAAISPWNFPLAIFVGQASAALAAGNVVLAKPAPQTPLVAAEAVRLMHGAGVPAGALQLLPGGAAAGSQLVRDPRVRGVLFTGSTRAAEAIDRDLAQRRRGEEAVLVAETGGQNAMIVDSSALPEQVVRDVLASAFDSAGQRCSALRLLCVQGDVADRMLAMLRGAFAQLRVGDPSRLQTDIGPVIDEAAAQRIGAHLATMSARHAVESPVLGPECGDGSFVAPAIVTVDSVAELTQEVFGPVLHVLRFERDSMGDLIEAINATGYALTAGVHSRIDETIDFVTERIRAGNVYVNRNMIGAVVGVQPFGGEGLSGTGPKAGGPWLLPRLRQVAAVRALAPPSVTSRDDAPGGLVELERWARERGRTELARLCERYRQVTPIGCRHVLAGPTGESNVLDYRPRRRVLCTAQDEAGLLWQLAAVLAAGSRAALAAGAVGLLRPLALPDAVARRIDPVDDGPAADIDLALQADGPDGGGEGGDSGVALRRALAQRPGARIRVVAGGPEYPLHWMVVERTVSTNTAAAGGNASLLSLEAD